MIWMFLNQFHVIKKMSKVFESLYTQDLSFDDSNHDLGTP